MPDEEKPAAETDAAPSSVDSVQPAAPEDLEESAESWIPPDVIVTLPRTEAPVSHVHGFDADAPPPGAVVVAAISHPGRVAAIEALSKPDAPQPAPRRSISTPVAPTVPPRTRIDTSRRSGHGDDSSSG